MRIERVVLEPHRMVGVHEVVQMEELSSFFGRALATVTAEMERRGVRPAGPPATLYQEVMSDKVDLVCGFPVDQAATAEGDIVVVMLPGGPAVETVHIGPYNGLHATYAELARWMTEHELVPSAVMWEQYVVGPDSESDPANWQTRVVYPVGQR